MMTSNFRTESYDNKQLKSVLNLMMVSNLSNECYDDKQLQN